MTCIRNTTGRNILWHRVLIHSYALLVAGSTRLPNLQSKFITTTACQAWSTTVLTNLPAETKPTPLFLSNKDDNSDINNSDDVNIKKDFGEASTGWNHNLPDPSSSFWNSEVEKQQKQEARQRGTSKETDTFAPRTGWLHKKKSKSSSDTKDTTSSSSSTTGSSVQSPNKAQARLQQAMKEQERNHRLLHPPTLIPCGNGRQIAITEHVISVPVDWDNPKGKSTSPQRIDLAFTIVEEVSDTTSQDYFLFELTKLQQYESPQKAAKSYIQDYAKITSASSMLLYLQGGPGFGAPTPVTGLGFTQNGSWASQALSCKEYTRIVLMDQRGTGKSTPITKQWLQDAFPNLFLLDDKETIDESLPEYSAVQEAISETADYMSNLRANSIVRDAEELRQALLLPPEPGTDPQPSPWGCAVGQSFGGFCLMTYLSIIPDPPKICIFTGGIAPMLTPVYDVYYKLWDRVKERNMRYYEVYPGDVRIVKGIVSTLLEQEQNGTPITLPSGGKLTARRFLQIGLGMGGSSPSSFVSLHNLVSTAFVSTTTSKSKMFSKAFLKYFDSAQSFDDHPIYFWLHESIYADGPDSPSTPTKWAAHRTYQDKIKESPDVFDYQVTCQQMEKDDVFVLFYGEMIFPWMAQDYAELSGYGLTQVVETLQSKNDWKPLYNATNMNEMLKGTTTSPPKCRGASAMYFDDLYVDFDFCQMVTSRGGPLDGVKVYVTNEYQHSGIRDGGAGLFTKLHGMAMGSTNVPS